MLQWDGDSDYDGEGNNIADWMARRDSDVARLNDPETETAGRSAWDAATRDGTNVAAQTPSDLRALGAAQLTCASPPSGNDLVQQLRAGARGATDAVFLGHANEIGAAAGSIPALFSGDPIGVRYQSLLQQGRDQDRFDEIHYPLARNAGEVAGTIGALAATDGLAAAAVPKFAASAYAAARAMPAMTRAERASVALGGAAVGVGGQYFSDLLSDHPSGWKDYAASALGGATTASGVTRLGPVFAGAASAGVRAVSNAALSGQRLDLASTAHDMVGAGYLSGVGRVVGEQESNRLPFRDKGKLGETMSDLKSFARGTPTLARQVPKQLSQGGKTVVDSIIDDEAEPFVESKFGPTARLSRPQRIWQTQNPGQVRNDYWMPSHVGQIGGAALSAFGVPMIDGWDQLNRRP